jgi:hypothetical protein
MTKRIKFNVSLSGKTISNLITEVKNSFNLLISISNAFLLELDDFGTIMRYRLSYYDPFYLYEMDTSTLNELDYYELETS